MVVPLLHHVIIHFFIARKATQIHAVIQTVMIKMKIRDIQLSYRNLLSMPDFLFQFVGIHFPICKEPVNLRRLVCNDFL